MAAAPVQLTDAQLAALIGESLAFIEGPLVIQTCISLFIWGLVYAQWITYLRRYFRHDAPVYKWSISLAVVLGTGNLLLDCSNLWLMAIPSSYLQTALTTGPRYIVKIWLGTPCVMICQWLLCYRLFILTGQRIVCAGLAFLAFTATLLFGVFVLVGDNLPSLNGIPKGVLNVEGHAEISFWIALVLDAALAIGLTLALRRRKQGFSAATDSLLDRIVHLVIGNCVLICLLQLGACISIRVALASPTSRVTTIPILFEDLIIPLYICSIILSLNLRGDNSGHSTGGSYPRGGSSGLTSASSKARASFATAARVQFETQTATHVDDDKETLGDLHRVGYPPAHKQADAGAAPFGEV